MASMDRRPAESLRPTLIRLPGYPLFLALCFKLFGMEHYHAVMFLQTVIDLASCILIAAFTRRIWNRRAGWWALWLAVLCPFTANYAAVPLTETLEIFWISVALYGLARFLQTTEEDPQWRWALLQALAWSYAALLRPDGALHCRRLVPGHGVVRTQALGHKTHDAVCRRGSRALGASLHSVDDAQLAHIPRLSAAGAALCHRSRRIHRSRLQSLDENRLRRSCLHLGGLLEH